MTRLSYARPQLTRPAIAGRGLATERRLRSERVGRRAPTAKMKRYSRVQVQANVSSARPTCADCRGRRNFARRYDAPPLARSEVRRKTGLHRRERILVESVLVALVARELDAQESSRMTSSSRDFKPRDWGSRLGKWLLIRPDLSQKISLEALGPFAPRDLERGDKAGRFRVRDRAEGVLRILGLPADDAAEGALRPMPKVPEPRT